MTTSLRSIIDRGPARITRAVVTRAMRPVHLLRARGLPEYHDPDASELVQIEEALRAQGVACAAYTADPDRFQAFKARMPFRDDYHGGEAGGVYVEKLLEHFVAWDMLGLDQPSHWPYVDIASASSPWAKILREQGLEAFSIDLAPHPSLAGLSYYLRGDATASPFDNNSIAGASLQCAFEMFVGDADVRLLVELARVLKPGGRAVISPLYMHTHACYYQSLEHVGRALGDAQAKQYVRRHAWDVPSSRKYSARTLVERVLTPARAAGLVPQVHVFRNKQTFGPSVYLHFILTLDKPSASASP